MPVCCSTVLPKRMRARHHVQPGKDALHPRRDGPEWIHLRREPGKRAKTTAIDGQGGSRRCRFWQQVVVINCSTRHPGCLVDRSVATAVFGARRPRSPSHLNHRRFFQCPRRRFAAASVSFPHELRTRTTVSRSNPRPISTVMSCSLGGGTSIRCRSCTEERAETIHLLKYFVTWSHAPTK